MLTLDAKLAQSAIFDSPMTIPKVEDEVIERAEVLPPPPPTAPPPPIPSLIGTKKSLNQARELKAEKRTKQTAVVEKKKEIVRLDASVLEQQLKAAIPHLKHVAEIKGDNVPIR